MHLQYLDRSRDRGRTESPKASWRIWAAILFCVCAAICLLVLFRPFFTSHFDLTESDLSDGRFELTVLEHWVKVFHGQAQIASPNFFYPERGVLGNSDTFLGLAIPHAVFRSLGIDRYLAVQLATMLLTAVGFAAMYLFLRKVFRFAVSTALVGASLFLLSNMYYIYVVHPYILVSVVNAPALFVMAAMYWREKDARPAKARLWLCLCGVALALMLYTSFYIGWFLGLCSAAVWVFYLACSVVAEPRRRPVQRALHAAWAEKWSLALAGVVFLTALIPFFMLYFPVVHHVGRRSSTEAVFYMPPVLGIFDVGRDNLVWGRVSGALESLISPEGLREHPAGWPFLTICFFLGSAGYCCAQLWHSRQEADDAKKRRLCLISAIALTCLTLWLLAVRFRQHAPLWKVLMKLVPGAAAIRVPQRIDLVLNIGVVVVCMFGFEQLRRALVGRAVLAWLVPPLLVSGLVVEQLNSMPTHLISRSAEESKFGKIPLPPKECSAFYISNWSATKAEKFVTQADAMMLAQQVDIPTLNGNSSWFPDGWDLMMAPKGQLSEKVGEWTRLKGVSGKICALDMNWAAWSLVDLQGHTYAAQSSEQVEGKVGDPGFENSDLALWTPFQDLRATLTRALAHSGVQSLGETEGTGSAYQDVTGLQPGTKYRVTAWVAASPGATAGVQMALFDTSRNLAVFSQTFQPSTEWQQLSEVLTVGDAGTLRIHLFRTAGTGTVYWDDVQLDIAILPVEAATNH